tara:strand:- start:653 stop:1207 length:555 start_codon:yes stop_codon:yes gene_type:complete
MTFIISDTSKNILSNIARISLENFLKNGEITKFNFNRKDILNQRAVFVTLWEKDSCKLRGCIGNIKALFPLVEAVSKTVISSATEDPRFVPLKKNELENIKIEINVLSPLKEISPDKIEIGKHGLHLIQGSCSGVFLPEVAASHEWDIKKYLDELSLKAGLNKGDWKNPGTLLLGFESESWSDN